MALIVRKKFWNLA